MAVQTKKLAVVVLNWNGAELLPGCLASLAAQSYKNFQIVVVDNGSKDNSKAVLSAQEKKLKTKLHVIYNSRNSGFAGGVNVGIRHALSEDFDSVALFNNDAVADKDWLRNLAEVLVKKPEVAIATGLLLHGDGKTIDSTGDWYSKWGLPFPRDRNQPTKKASPAGFVFGASGGASLYRIRLFEDIGLFDEIFFAYYEDVDVSFRAQLAGWKIYYTDEAVAYHERGTSSNRIHGFAVYQTFKNLPLLFIKNVPAQFWGIVGPRLFLAYWLMLFNTAKNGGSTAGIRGLAASLFYTPGAFARRRHIQKNRRALLTYLNNLLWQDLPPDQTGLRKFRSVFKK